MASTHLYLLNKNALRILSATNYKEPSSTNTAARNCSPADNNNDVSFPLTRDPVCWWNVSKKCNCLHERKNSYSNNFDYCSVSHGEGDDDAAFSSSSPSSSSPSLLVLSHLRRDQYCLVIKTIDVPSCIHEENFDFLRRFESSIANNNHHHEKAKTLTTLFNNNLHQVVHNNPSHYHHQTKNPNCVTTSDNNISTIKISTDHHHHCDSKNDHEKTSPVTITKMKFYLVRSFVDKKQSAFVLGWVPSIVLSQQSIKISSFFNHNDNSNTPKSRNGSFPLLFSNNINNNINPANIFFAPLLSNFHQQQQNNHNNHHNNNALPSLMFGRFTAQGKNINATTSSTSCSQPQNNNEDDQEDPHHHHYANSLFKCKLVKHNGSYYNYLLQQQQQQSSSSGSHSPSPPSSQSHSPSPLSSPPFSPQTLVQNNGSFHQNQQQLQNIRSSSTSSASASPIQGYNLLHHHTNTNNNNEIILDVFPISISEALNPPSFLSATPISVAAASSSTTSTSRHQQQQQFQQLPLSCQTDIRHLIIFSDQNESSKLGEGGSGFVLMGAIRRSQFYFSSSIATSNPNNNNNNNHNNENEEISQSLSQQQQQQAPHQIVSESLEELQTRFSNHYRVTSASRTPLHPNDTNDKKPNNGRNFQLKQNDNINNTKVGDRHPMIVAVKFIPLAFGSSSSSSANSVASAASASTKFEHLRREIIAHALTSSHPNFVKLFGVYPVYSSGNHTNNILSAHSILLANCSATSNQQQQDEPSSSSSSFPFLPFPPFKSTVQVSHAHRQQQQQSQNRPDFPRSNRRLSSAVMQKLIGVSLVFPYCDGGSLESFISSQGLAFAFLDRHHRNNNNNDESSPLNSSPNPKHQENNTNIDRNPASPKVLLLVGSPPPPLSSAKRFNFNNNHNNTSSRKKDKFFSGLQQDTKPLRRSASSSRSANGNNSNSYSPNRHLNFSSQLLSDDKSNPEHPQQQHQQQQQAQHSSPNAKKNLMMSTSTRSSLAPSPDRQQGEKKKIHYEEHDDQIISNQTFFPLAPLREFEILSILQGVASGLHFLHNELGFAHRDMKPGNILVTSRGEVLIADLGIAKQVTFDKTIFIKCDCVLTNSDRQKDQQQNTDNVMSATFASASSSSSFQQQQQQQEQQQQRQLENSSFGGQFANSIASVAEMQLQNSNVVPSSKPSLFNSNNSNNFQQLQSVPLRSITPPPNNMVNQPTFCGTFFFCAPEIYQHMMIMSKPASSASEISFQQHHHPHELTNQPVLSFFDLRKADIFSLGVVMRMLFFPMNILSSGQVPEAVLNHSEFCNGDVEKEGEEDDEDRQGAAAAETQKKGIDNQFSSFIHSSISAEFKKLVSQFLKANPDDRISAEGILSSKSLKELFCLPGETLSSALSNTNRNDSCFFASSCIANLVLLRNHIIVNNNRNGCERSEYVDEDEEDESISFVTSTLVESRRVFQKILNYEEEIVSNLILMEKNKNNENSNARQSFLPSVDANDTNNNNVTLEMLSCRRVSELAAMKKNAKENEVNDNDDDDDDDDADQSTAAIPLVEIAKTTKPIIHENNENGVQYQEQSSFSFGDNDEGERQTVITFRAASQQQSVTRNSNNSDNTSNNNNQHHQIFTSNNNSK